MTTPARAERFFTSLKRAEVDVQPDQPCAEAEAKRARFSADVDKRKRRHASLGSRPSVEFEAQAAAASGRCLGRGSHCGVHAKARVAIGRGATIGALWQALPGRRPCDPLRLERFDDRALRLDRRDGLR